MHINKSWTTMSNPSHPSPLPKPITYSYKHVFKPLTSNIKSENEHTAFILIVTLNSFAKL